MKVRRWRLDVRPTSVLQHSLVVLTVIVGLMLGVGGSQLIWDRGPRLRSVTPLYKPTGKQTDGDYLVFVFVGHSACRWSNMPDLPESIEELKLRLSVLAEREQMGFRAIGIATDIDVSDGHRYLANFGLFDEISLGGYFTNLQTIRYFWSEGLVVATPLVAVFKMRITIPGDLSRPFSVGASEPVRVAAVRGVSAIETWVESGDAFPRWSGVSSLSDSLEDATAWQFNR